MMSEAPTKRNPELQTPHEKARNLSITRPLMKCSQVF
jgi:hypothetical protein